MNTIILHTKDNYFYYTSKYTDSEIMMRHINHGERKIYGKDDLLVITKLAEMHGWEIKIQNDVNI